MAKIDIDIDELLDEANSDCMIDELKRRCESGRKEYSDITIEYVTTRLKHPVSMNNKFEKLTYLYEFLGIKPYHGIERLRQEFEELLT
jgi:ppGpp synthetase/RelA/SpoT-type nucleotidyltranferase